VTTTTPPSASLAGRLSPALRAVLGAAAAVVLTACATPQRPDPLEPINRRVYAFNDAMDRAVVRPVATVYRDHVPAPVRTAATNFFTNLQDVWSSANLLLQGRPGDSLSDLLRFGVNTTFGVFGLFDWATDLGLERHGEDFGQTLGKWGFGPGAYIVLPLLGPSSLRDSVGLPLEWKMYPDAWVTPATAQYSLAGVRLLNARANVLQASQLFNEIALDPYVAMRDAYLQRRRSLVYDGNPPDDAQPEERWDEPEAPAAPAAPASSPAASAAPVDRAASAAVPAASAPR